MRHLWAILLLGAVSACAQDVAAYVHDPSGVNPDTALSSAYQYAATPVGNAASLLVRLKNTSGNAMVVITSLVASASGSNTLSPNFTITGQLADKSLSASNFEDIAVNFAPLAQGAINGYLQVVYQVQKNGCVLNSPAPATQCPSQTLLLSTLSGNGLPPVLLLTYPAANGSATVLQPFSATALSFGNISTSATSSIVFTLTNQTGAAVSSPAVSLTSQVFGSSAFSLNTAALPASIAAGASGSFTVTFAPGQTGLASATLVVGTLSYPLQGTGVVVADIDALQISYVDSAGVRTLPQAATPISLGQVVAGTNAPATLAFTVSNPSTSWNAVAVSTLTATGAGFALSNAPSVPLSIQPGSSIAFTLVFNPGATGTYAGTLSIGARQFLLSGSSITSALPAPSLSVDLSPLTSGQQAHLSVQLAAASTVSAIGQLTLAFTPSVANVSDDPAIVFQATGGRQLQLTVASGAQTAAYNGQSSIGFQTGTTAGTLTFTLTFPNKAPVSQTFTIAPEIIAIAKATAVRQSPNLVVTISGFDNTYTAGKLAFTFLDTSGKAMTPGSIAADASSTFASFFRTSTAGGAFSLQATFPVTGDAATVGSVAVQLSNSAGTTTQTVNFQ